MTAPVIEYVTRNSVYQYDPIARRVRRVTGENAPTVSFSDTDADGWIDGASVTLAQLGDWTVAVFAFDDGRSSTITSALVETREGRA